MTLDNGHPGIYTVGMDTIGQRESIFAMAENAQEPAELELAIVALAQIEAANPGDAVVQALHRQLAERFAATIEPLDHEISVEEKVRKYFGMATGI